LKKYFLLFVLILTSVIVKAQGDYNFSPYGVGFGVSTIRGYTNVAKQNNTLAANINFTYNYSPYLPITLELEDGRLWGGSRVTDPSKREYENSYMALYIHADLQLGQIIDYDYSSFNEVIKNLYFGGGFGFVNDNVQNQRTNINTSSQYPTPGTYVFPGTDKSLNLAIPMRLGYEVKIYNEYDEPFIRVDFEYQHNIVFGEGLDGYDDPPSQFKNQHPDQYREISVVLKYNFGTIRAFTKRIRGTSF
jgi:hypothetical protein